MNERTPHMPNMVNERISVLTMNQTHDPARGPFHVKPSPCRRPRHHQGHRVHVDAYGERFVILPA